MSWTYSVLWFSFDVTTRSQTLVCDFKIIVSEITIAINRFRKELKTIKILLVSTFNLSYANTTNGGCVEDPRSQ